MDSIQYNGVGFNVDAVFLLGKDKFLNGDYIFWKHLNKEDFKTELLNAWEIIEERHGKLNTNAK